MSTFVEYIKMGKVPPSVGIAFGMLIATLYLGGCAQIMKLNHEDTEARSNAYNPLKTVVLDGHTFIVHKTQAQPPVHHPDCPCHKKL